jgi:hypothetical protein
MKTGGRIKRATGAGAKPPSSGAHRRNEELALPDAQQQAAPRP